MRNAVNYSHRFGTWFPYAGRSPYFSRLYDRKHDWLKDPMSIELVLQEDKELQKFQATCNFLVARCRVLAIDMERRCSLGKSFHSFGSAAVLNLMARGKIASKSF